MERFELKEIGSAEILDGTNVTDDEPTKFVLQADNWAEESRLK